MIGLSKFGGEIPLLSDYPHLLPDGFAQEAINCDFSQGVLRPLKDGVLLATMSGTVKTIYTEDGINFYTWPTETQVFKSPVLSDPYGRVYYLDGGVLRAAAAAGASPSGGPPGASYKVGVPAPQTAPELSVVERTTFPDYPTAVVEITCWLEESGQRYQETTPSVTTVTALREYTFDIPTATGGTPATAVPKARVRFLEGGASFLSVTLGTTDGEVRSQALPGGVTVTLTPLTLPNHKIALSYGVVETRAYVYTNVNTWNEQSGPSPASTIKTTYVQDVQVEMTAESFVDYRPFMEFRAYRTSGANPTYLRIHSGALASFQDESHKASEFGDSLDTLEYGAVPALLDGLCMLPGGVLCGFKGSMIYLAEPYRPHAWGYEVAMRTNVRGLLSLPQALLVTTADGCSIVMGAHPSQMTPISLGIPQSGIAMRSMANLDGLGVFASRDGIVEVNGSRASLERSQRLFNRAEWQDRYGTILADASMRFAWHDGALVATSANAANGFLIRFDEQSAGLYTKFPQQYDATFFLPVNDALYYSIGANVYQFAAGSNLSYTWHSREYTAAHHVSLGAGYLRASGSVTMTVYADDVQVFSGSVQPGYFRLPGGRAARRWSVRLQGTATVEELFLARTMRELQHA